MRCIASGVIFICSHSDFLYINTELLHVYLLAWLSYIYLPLFSEKAFAAKPYCPLLLSREIPHKLGKVLFLSLDSLSGTCPMLPPCCSSILKGMLDNVKKNTLLQYVFQFIWFFQKLDFFLYFILDPVLILSEDIPSLQL